MTAIDSAVRELRRQLAPVAAQLGLPNPENLNAIDQLKKVISHLSYAPGIPQSWHSKDMVETARSQAREQADTQAWRDRAVFELNNRGSLSRARITLTELEAAEEALMAKYDPGILNVVDQSMLTRYRTDHQSTLKRLLPGSFRRDQDKLRSFRRSASKLSLEDGLSLVQQALDVLSRQRAWEALSEELDIAMGSKFDGRRTDWEAIEAYLLSTEVDLTTLNARQVERQPELETCFGELYNGFENRLEAGGKRPEMGVRVANHRR